MTGQPANAFERALASGAPILTDGGIETEIMFGTGYAMDPDLQVGAMVLDPAGLPLIRSVYERYVRAAERAGVPIVIGTPTFRASANFARASGRSAELEAINRRAVAMHRELAAGAATDVFVAGVLGPARDAYTPGEALGVAEAEDYHREQAGLLADAGVDFLFAATFPALDEAVGVGRAIVSTGLPGVVSLVLDGAGLVLDGTPLAAAVGRLDDEVEPPLAYVSLSCIHTSVAARALAGVGEARPRARAEGERFSDADQRARRTRPPRVRSTRALRRADLGSARALRPAGDRRLLRDRRRAHRGARRAHCRVRSLTRP